jgi:CheY-like chemotaxis protein/AraC-like DNA-binding protein
MDTRRYIVNPETIDLGEYIGELHEYFGKTAENRGIGLDLRMPSREPGLTVVSDYDALTKLIGNLLTNALKFTRTRIVLGLAVNADGSYTVSVEDDGPGVSRSHRKLIFDPFYQVHKEDAKKGAGIGLSLVKHMADVLKGEIEVKDSPLGGALFSFTFSDIARDLLSDNAESPSGAETMTGVADAKAGARKNSILVVDDNPDMIRFIRETLQNDYTVETAVGGAEAFGMLEERSFDLILSDVMMPHTDGISFTKKLRSDPLLSHIPVILLSARTENEAKAEGLLSGADVFIEKPFSTLHLKAQIASLLENRRAILEAFNRSPLAFYSNFSSRGSDPVFLTRLNEEIEKHISEESFSVESLTDVLGISRSSLQRKVKHISGVTPGDYLRNYRMKKACELLLEPDMRVNEVAFRVGYTSPSYFARTFYKSYNMSPKEFATQKGNL